MKRKLSRMRDHLILLAIFTITNGAILKLAIWLIDVPSIQYTYWQCVGIILIGRHLYAWLIFPMDRKKILEVLREEMKEEMEKKDEDISDLKDQIKKYKEHFKKVDAGLNQIIRSAEKKGGSK